MEKQIFKKLNGIEPEDYSVLAEPHLSKIRQCIHELWNDLMTNEMVFMDQLEEIINEFERNLEEKVASFIETVQVLYKFFLQLILISVQN